MPKYRTLLTAVLFLLSISPFLYFSRSLFLKDPLIWPDEAIFLNTARSIGTNGVPATNLFGNTIPGMTIRANWYPPLYFYLLYIWTGLFGTSIEAVRILSIIFGFGALVVFWLILSKLFHSRWLVVLGMLMLSSNYAFGQGTRVARMDMFSFFLMLGAYYFYVCYLKTTHGAGRNYWLLSAGIICALAIVTHPLGLIAPATIVLHWIIVWFIQNNKKQPIDHIIKPLLLLCAPSMIAMSAWGLSMASTWGFFLEQYRLQFARKATEYSFSITMSNGFTVWRILFISYFLLYVFGLWRLKKNKDATAGLFLLGAIISSVILLWGKEFWYILYYQPFMTLILLASWPLTWKEKHEKILYIVCSLIALVLLSVHIYMNFVVYEENNSDGQAYHEFTRRIRSVLPLTATVLLVTIPDPYFDLSREKGLTLYEFPTVPVSQAAYKNLLDTIDIVILNITSDKYTPEYVKRNTQHITGVGTPNGYHTTVITLVPRDKRK